MCALVFKPPKILALVLHPSVHREFLGTLSLHSEMVILFIPLSLSLKSDISFLGRAI